MQSLKILSVLPIFRKRSAEVYILYMNMHEYVYVYIYIHYTYYNVNTARVVMRCLAGYIVVKPAVYCSCLCSVYVVQDALHWHTAKWVKVKQSCTERSSTETYSMTSWRWIASTVRWCDDGHLYIR